MPATSASLLPGAATAIHLCVGGSRFRIGASSPITFLTSSPLSKPSLFSLFSRHASPPPSRPKSFFSHPSPFSPVMEWQDCNYNVTTKLIVGVRSSTSSCSTRARLDVDVPCSIAYKCYSDREAIPRWMPFISSVKVLEDQPDLSRWSLKYTAFGQDLEFSWLARNMQPIPNQKIHWRTLEGLPNKGAVRFYPKGPASCSVDLTVSYEVPQILTPVSSALRPFLEGLLLRGLERFAEFAKEYQVNSQKA